MIHFAAVTRGHTAAIVGAEWPTEGKKVVCHVERLPFDIGVIARRLRELKAEHPDACITVDGEGIGSALWLLLDDPRPRREWALYDKHGPDRRELTDVLLEGEARGSYGFRSGLAEEQAMKAALLGAKRDPREDGPGSDLVVALSLSVADHHPPPPQIY